MQILWLLYLRDLSIHRVWYLWGSWNQYPMDTEAQWYGFGRYKDEEGMVKSKRKKNSVYWHNWNLISDHCHLPPVLGSKMSAKKSRGWLYTIKKKELPIYSMCFYLIPFPLSYESLCVLRLAVCEIPGLDLAEVSELTVEKIRKFKKKYVSQECLKIRRVFFVVLFFCYWWRM